jgi:hypothetical protein
LVWHLIEEGEIVSSYVVTLCDSKDLNGQDTLKFVQVFEPGEVLWTTNVDLAIEDFYIVDGSVNIITPQVKTKKNKNKNMKRTKNNPKKSKNMTKKMNKKKDGKKMIRG